MIKIYTDLDEEIDDKIFEFFDKLSQEYNIIIFYNDFGWDYSSNVFPEED